MPTIAPAESEPQISRCFPVMVQLRPHLREADFFARVRSQQESQGYRLVFAEAGGKVVGVAGFRILENLSWGRFLHVDDLVTDTDSRSGGHGAALFAWLVEHAKTEGCVAFHLDSGVQRFAAHRFYLRHRMEITCHHFALAIT